MVGKQAEELPQCLETGSFKLRHVHARTLVLERELHHLNMHVWYVRGPGTEISVVGEDKRAFLK